MKHWDRGPQIWWNTFSRIPQHRRDATFPCWYKGTWSGSDNTPARDSHMGAGGEKPQEETRKNSEPGGACDDKGAGCCHQVICWASPVPAKASQGTQGCEVSFQRSPAAVSGSPEGWQDPAPEDLSTLLSCHFQHRHTGASPPILGQEDTRTLLAQMGRGDTSTAHDVLVLWGWCPVERGQHCCAMPQNAGGRSQVTASKTHHGRAHSSANTQMLCCWGIALQGQGIALHIPSKSFQRAKEKRKD